jgi:hypothetical protein
MLPWVAGYVIGQRAAGRAAAMSVVSNHMAGTGAQAVPDERVDRLLVVVEAMWSLLREHGHTDEELAGRIEELEKSRAARSTITCRSCGSRLPADLPRCQICGTETGAKPDPLGGLHSRPV